MTYASYEVLGRIVMETVVPIVNQLEDLPNCKDHAIYIKYISVTYLSALHYSLGTSDGCKVPVILCRYTAQCYFLGPRNALSLQWRTSPHPFNNYGAPPDCH